MLRVLVWAEGTVDDQVASVGLDTVRRWLVELTMMMLMFLVWAGEEQGVSGHYQRAYDDVLGMLVTLNFHLHRLEKTKQNELKEQWNLYKTDTIGTK